MPNQRRRIPLDLQSFLSLCDIEIQYKYITYFTFILKKFAYNIPAAAAAIVVAVITPKMKVEKVFDFCGTRESNVYLQM